MVQAAGAGCCNPFRAGALLVHYRSGARATIASKLVCACRPASRQGECSSDHPSVRPRSGRMSASAPGIGWALRFGSAFLGGPRDRPGMV